MWVTNTTGEILRIKVWDKEGRIIASDNKDILGDEFADNKAFIKAMDGEVLAISKPKEKPENVVELRYGQLMEVYVPIFGIEGNAIGVVETYTSLDSLNKQIGKVQWFLIAYMLVVTVLVLALIGVVLTAAYKKITVPIDHLIKLTKKIGEGNLDARVKIGSETEISHLAASINKMADDLKKSTISRKDLEKEVSDKTRKLQDSMEKMDRFNKLMVDRELKMTELKKKLSEYEKE